MCFTVAECTHVVHLVYKTRFTCSDAGQHVSLTVNSYYFIW